MKNITIAGNVGKDAVLRTTQKGDNVLGFAVAVDDGWGDQKRTIWFDCSMWGQRGARVADYLTKGTKVTVSGDLSTREHEGRTYLTVRVAELTLQGGGGEPRSGGYDGRGDHQGPATGGAGGGGFGSGARGGTSDDDFGDSIPFAPEWR